MLKFLLTLGVHVLQKVDNVPMLQLDIVWCYFVLRDVSCLEVAGARLEKARLGFERSHGKDSTRFRILQAGRQADLAMWDPYYYLPLAVLYFFYRMCSFSIRSLNCYLDTNVWEHLWKKVSLSVHVWMNGRSWYLLLRKGKRTNRGKEL